MIDIIPPQYRILAALVGLALLFSLGFGSGHHWATVTADAKAYAAQKEYQRQVDALMVRANDLSARLAAAEGKIVTHTVEVIKYVPKYTTGKPCLSAGAVGVLQPGAGAPGDAPGKPPAEDATPVASDTDVAYWIAGANQQYETCAARLNALIDFSSTP